MNNSNIRQADKSESIRNYGDNGSILISSLIRALLKSGKLKPVLFPAVSEVLNIWAGRSRIKKILVKPVINIYRKVRMNLAHFVLIKN